MNMVFFLLFFLVFVFLALHFLSLPPLLVSYILPSAVCTVEKGTELTEETCKCSNFVSHGLPFEEIEGNSYKNCVQFLRVPGGFKHWHYCSKPWAPGSGRVLGEEWGGCCKACACVGEYSEIIRDSCSSVILLPFFPHFTLHVSSASSLLFCYSFNIF